MAEIQVERRKSAGQLTWLWMLLAVALVGGFMYWLAVTSEPSVVQVVETEAADTASGTAVALAAFAASPDTFTTLVRIDNLRVASRMGPHAFWTQFPNETPYLVKLDSALVAQGTSVTSGEVVSVTGRVQRMTDSVVAAWQRQGAITDDAQRAEAEFAESFLEVSGLRRATGGGTPQQ